jgi:glycosyltransferase involved in cell wall biosynthesis
LSATRPVVLLLGPSLEALSGVSTHLNLLLGSRLATECNLIHFQVGAEGRRESLAGRILRLLASPFQLGAAIVRHNADLVHINTSLNPGAYWRDLAYLAVAKLCGARVVYQVHGGALPEEFFKNRLLKEFLRKTLSAPDCVVVLASTELKAYRAFVPRQDLAAMPNGIDCRPYPRRTTAPVDPAAPLKLTFIGRFAREKGLYEVIEALRLARFRGIATRLVIAGGGAEEVRLRQRVRELALSADVAFAGPVQGEKKARLLAQSDVLLLPSYAEGLPYALLEGMAAGAVPIATRVGAIPDVMEDGVHGRFVPVRDPEAIAQAIAALAADRDALARMSAASRQRIVATYSITRLASQLNSLYARLCAARTPKTAL